MTRLSTTIARVTVFRDGARVTRIGKKKLEIAYSYEVEWEKDIRISPPLP